MAAKMVAVDNITEMAGTQLGTSEWLTVTQDMINQFADCTLDHQYIHIDEEKAALTPFGGTIAHGFLTLSLMVELTKDLSVFPEGMVMGINYGMNKLRFLAPVRAGKRIRAHVELAAVERKDEKRFLTTQNVTVEIEGEDTPALVAEWLGMSVIA